MLPAVVATTGVSYASSPSEKLLILKIYYCYRVWAPDTQSVCDS